MDKNNNNCFKNVRHGTYEDFMDSQDINNLKSHNEKRKAQDSSINDLRDSQDNKIK
ncbi:MAG TPA: hypothetical protein VEA58_03090 [Anaerovoracaceae bacterium]|nr:hypothetical protein [Anaerovoracaceae bacterium]